MQLSEPINVITAYDATKKHFQPHFIKWRNRVYKVTKIGLHHKERSGRVLEHVYSLVAGGVFFQVRFNTDSLDWILQEVREYGASA